MSLIQSVDKSQRQIFHECSGSDDLAEAKAASGQIFQTDGSALITPRYLSGSIPGGISKLIESNKCQSSSQTDQDDFNTEAEDRSKEIINIPNMLCLDTLQSANDVSDPFQDIGIYTQEDLAGDCCKEAQKIDEFLTQVLGVKQVNLKQLQEQIQKVPMSECRKQLMNSRYSFVSSASSKSLRPSPLLQRRAKMWTQNSERMSEFEVMAKMSSLKQ